MKHVHAGLIAGLILGFAAATVAEDVTVQTYYPSPKGVYEELRTTGDVGVGITTAPGARLRVVQSNAADAFRVDDSTGDPTPFLIDQNGNVGIGTAAPGAALEFDTPSPWTVFRTAGAEWFRLASDGGSLVRVTAQAGRGLSFGTGGATERVVVTSSGDVGIGTATPATRLQVNGALRVDGAFSGTFNGADTGPVQLVWCGACAPPGYYAYAVYAP